MKMKGILTAIALVLTIKLGSSQFPTPNDRTFSIQPQPGVWNVLIDTVVEFQCSPQEAIIPLIDIIQWIIVKPNGEQYTPQEEKNLGITDRRAYNNYTLNIPIKEDGLSNMTRVWCRIHYTSGGSKNSNRQGTISIQGRLDAVSDLTDTLLDPGRSTSIEWTPPYTLNISGTEPDIVYCIDVAEINSSMSRQIYHECNITCSNYTLNFEEGKISPCNNLSVTVTPYNGYYRNISGTQNTAIVHLNQGVRNFSASDVNQTVVETKPNVLNFTLTLPVSVATCPHFCRITTEANQTLDFMEDGLDCHDDILNFEVSNNSTVFTLKTFCTIGIEVGNSAGLGFSTGKLTLSTHLIQNVTSSSNGSTLRIGIEYVQGNTLWGAQAVLVPTVLNKNTCATYVRRNIPKTSEVVNIEDIPGGDYSLKVYVVEESGIPDKQAVAANLPRNLSFAGATKTSVSELSIDLDVRRGPLTELTITYPPLASGSQYIGVLADETTYILIIFDSSPKTVPIANDTEYCFSVFTVSEGNISPIAVTNIYVDSELPETDKKGNIGEIIGVIIVIIFVIIVIIVIIGLPIVIRLRRKVVPNH